MGSDGTEVWPDAEIVLIVDDVKDSRTSGVEVAGTKEVESSDAGAEVEQSESKQGELPEAGDCEVDGSEEMETGAVSV